MKKLLLIVFGVMLSVGLFACGNTENTAPTQGASKEEAVQETSEPISLEGTWKQVNNNSEDSWQEATIQGNSISVWWVSDGGDTKSLYWAGTYDAPEPGVTSFTWTSVNDTEQTSTALLASDAETKDFSYDNSQISYEVTALGTTTTVKLEKE